jgi:actin related protein 2/3 complex subunit 5
LAEEAEMAEEAEAETDAALLAAVEDKDGQVDKLVAAKKLEEALTVALADPPIGTKDREIKDLACSTVLRVIAATKDKEIEALVTGVSDTEEDVLMKYLYA